MTSTALVSTRPEEQLVHATAEPPVIITNEQTDLIRKTIAAEATDAELALFFYDCRRRGVHPLDKLIHFTKRGGKYTPVTSIDFFRSRAAKTREHMGTDDVVYAGSVEGGDFAATCTVYRMVQGERCAYTATARFAEYLPDPPNDFMWRRMPHSQIGKCAEALALRRGFPQELADLHTFEELEQGRDDVHTPKRTVQRASGKVVVGGVVTEPRLVKDVRPFGTKGNFAVVLDGETNEYTTKDGTLAGELGKFKGTDHRVRITYKDNEWNGKTYHNLESFVVDDTPASPPQNEDPKPEVTRASRVVTPLSATDIPFGR